MPQQRKARRKVAKRARTRDDYQVAAPAPSLSITLDEIVAWASDLHASTSLCDRDPRWLRLAALSDQHAQDMCVSAKDNVFEKFRQLEDVRLAAQAYAVLRQRYQLGAALVTQRILTEAALGPLFATLDGATVQIILFEVAVTSLVDYSSIAGVSSAFLGHAREISDSGDRFWRPHALKRSRLLRALVEAASPPPNLFRALLSRRDPPPPGESKWYLPNNDDELTMAVLPETQKKLSDFVLAAELWWEGKLVGASTGRLGSTFAVEDLSYCHRIEVGNLFGGGFTDVPSCFAHGTDNSEVPWEKLYLRLILCDATSFATRCIYEGTPSAGFDFSASPILCFPADDEDGAAEIQVFSHLDQDLLEAYWTSLETHADTTAPLEGCLMVQLECLNEDGTPEDVPEDVVRVLSALFLNRAPCLWPGCDL